MSDRRSNPADPTAERTSEMSTPTASGLTGGRPGQEQARRNDDNDDLLPRPGDDARTAPPRRNKTEGDDAVLPTDDASLGTKI